jgi:hypothetical protein
MDNAHVMEITFTKEITYKKYGWIWNPENGERYRIETDSGRYKLELGPAESKLFVFDKDKKGRSWSILPTGNLNSKNISQWTAECKHINGSVTNIALDALKDIKDIPELQNFCGTIIYRSRMKVGNPGEAGYLNLGKVEGISELIVNGMSCGVQWYGRRVYSINDKIKTGDNEIEIKIITGLLNYMKSLKENPVAQYWTNDGRRNQPLQSMGLIGPVSYY